MPCEKMIFGAEKWFRAHGYITVSPYQVRDDAIAQRHEVCEFFNEDGTFELKARELVDAFLIYKEEKIRGVGLSIATALVVF
jgi:hypothetical protein